MPSYKIIPSHIGNNNTINLMNRRMGNLDIPPTYYKDTVDAANHMAQALIARGGFPQQERMIRDKRKALDKATLYSYQAVRIKKIQSRDNSRDEPLQSSTVRALINPNKLKVDYDEKILSVGFEHNFQCGDIFEWERTKSYWLIYMQNLDETAYFKGNIRRCSYFINWINDDGEKCSTFVAVRGPVETRIDDVQKHNIAINQPNYSLDILMPKNEETMKRFQRYSTFYLKDNFEPDSRICWRVEATDSISVPGILEVVAVEYYADKDKDDIENGLVGVLEPIPQDPNPDTSHTVLFIAGDTFIKPKKEYVYTLGIPSKKPWTVDKKYPVVLEPYEDEKGNACVKVKWISPYSGEFELSIGNYKKSIVVESLF